MKSNKILSFIIALIFISTSMLACFPGIGASASSISLYDSDYDNAGKLLKALCPDMPLNEGAVTTRAEFVAAVTMLMNIPMSAAADSGFSDVAPTDPFATNIAYAANLGLISNVDLFYPDAPITYAQAVKILMVAAGFGTKAEYMGGFPTGYLMMANEAEVGLGVNIGTDAQLTHAEALSLIFDAAVTDMMEATAFGDAYEYTTVAGKNILSVYHEVYMAQGIVEANENSGLYGLSGVSGEHSITINEKTFFGEGYENFLGKRARVFYDKDNKNAIIYAYELENATYDYSELDNLTVTGSKLTVAPGDKASKELKYTMADVCPLILNGKYYGGADYNAVINPSSGTVQLVDNNANGDIDVIIVKKIEYGIISGVNEFEGKVYDKYKNGGLIDVGDVSVNYFVRESDGTPLKLEDLNDGDKVGYAISDDRRLFEIIRYTGKVGGGFEAVTTDGKIVVKGEEYKLSEYYRENIKELSDLKAGTDVILHLGEANQIIYIEEFSSDIKYGVLAGVGKMGTLGSSYMTKIYTQDGTMLEAPLAKKVRVNGTSMDAKDANDVLTLTLAKDLIMRVIKFALNSDNEVSKVYETVLNDRGSAVMLEENKAESNPVLFYNNGGWKLLNSATHEYSDTEYEFKPFYKNGVVYPLFSLASGCQIIKAPVRPVDIDIEKMYSTATIAELNQGVENLSCFGYDVDKNGAAFLLLPQLEVGVEAFEEDAEPGCAIVESVTSGINNDGDKATVVRLYVDGEWKKVYSKPENQAKVEALRPGDIIAYSANSYGELNILEPHFSYANDKSFYRRPKTFDSAGNPTEWYGGVGTFDIYTTRDTGVTVLNSGGKRTGYVGGYAYNLSGGTAMLIRNSAYKNMADLIAAVESPGFVFDAGDMYPVKMQTSRTVFVKFINDRVTGETISAQVYTESDMSNMETYFNAGSDADYVVSRERFHALSLNIVYVNEYLEPTP